VLVCFGLYRILARVGAADFVDRLALLSLLVALPQAALWVVLRMNYAFLATKFLLMLLAPLYLGAVIASALPKGMAPHLVETKRPPAPIAEILASFAVACLLFAAIGLSSRPGERQPPAAARADWQVRPS